MSLAEVAAKGDRLASLQALRDRLATDLDECESKRDVAALSQRLMDVLEQIADIEKAQPAKEGTALDEFSRRRAAKSQAPRAKGTARSK